MPDRLGYNRQYTSFRKQLIINGAFVDLAYRVPFPYVVADTLIYCYRPQTEKALENTCLVGEFSGEKFEARQRDFLLVDDFQLLPMGPVIKKLYIGQSKTKRLGDLLRTSVGFIAKSGSVTEQSIGEANQPVLKGRNIFRYRVEGQFYFRFAKSNLVGGTQSVEKLGMREKILMRKTGYPLYSAFDDTGRYPEQSLYFLYEPKEGMSLKYVLGIVNSPLFQYAFWNRMATNRNATP
ncbi:MAG: hypothetical protein H8D43_02985, partial [Chloroflexi bacterium]|nr:hypothetical protein [Chloroflexota bacterium]